MNERQNLGNTREGTDALANGRQILPIRGVLFAAEHRRLDRLLGKVWRVMSKRPQIGHNLGQNAVPLNLQKLLQELNDSVRLQAQDRGAELRILKLKTHLLQALFQRGLHALELKLAQLFRTEHTVRTILAGTVEKLAKLQRRLHTLQRPLSQLGQNVKGNFRHLIPDLDLIDLRILTNSLLPSLGKLHSAIKFAQLYKSRQFLGTLTQITHRVQAVAQRIREGILQ